VVLPSNVSESPGPPTPQERRRRPRAGLATLLLSLLGLVIVVAALIYFGVALGLRPGASPAPAARAPSAPSAPTATAADAAAPSGPTATPADASAIQQVIQHGDEAQAQALANKDPSGMRDLATPDYYEQMVTVNQDLLDSGVTAVKLVRIEWGAITVTGDSATATCYETWTTTFADGSVDQSRDLNVYTLVRDNGAWKVQSDDHPNSPAGGQQGP
jgi:hypothetical protein